jgi:hypothetical protein
MTTHWPALALLYLLIAAAWTGSRTEPNARCLAETALPLEYVPPGTASHRALNDSAFWWTQSVQAANDDYDDRRAALKAWDPEAVSDDHTAEIRRLMASDPRGYLLRARRAAVRAAAQARTLRERERAARQVERLERAAGRRETELPAFEGTPGKDAGARSSSREPPVARLE